MRRALSYMRSLQYTVFFVHSYKPVNPYANRVELTNHLTLGINCTNTKPSRYFNSYAVNPTFQTGT